MIQCTARASLLLVLALLLTGWSHAAPKNVVVFFVDDMGWTDLGCTGSDFYETPNIDALAKSGVRFTNGYAACTVCSPSRAALMTGQSPARLHVTDFIPGHPFVNTPMTIPDWTKVLEKKHTTLPEILKPHGYTCIHLGKWHLAHRDGYETGQEDSADPDNYPQAHGFDINIGGCEKGAPPSYFWPYGKGRSLESRKDNTIYQTLPQGDLSDRQREGEYLTNRLAAEAETLIDQFAASEKPFFMNFCFYNVHTPLMGRPDLVEKYERKLKENPQRKHTNVRYAAMVESVDEAVGRVVDKLQEHNLWNDTLVIFTSDNGGLKPVATDNAPLRQGKGGIYEGGVRVPLIIRLPGAGATDALCERPAITMDILPTICDVLQIDLPAEAAKVQDGLTLRPYLTNPQAPPRREDLFWHYPHYHSMGAQPYSAIRSGDWKLIEVFGKESLELYNLASDLGENDNLVTIEKEKANELYAKLVAWRESVEAQVPTGNPQYDPEKETGIVRNGKLRKASPIRAQ
ncbi:Arylsulfatase [Stieleria maiorica]|uniref:Arylsulfatase n=1 Tax=Stieleria maiorica TaxID=2795974 RepID=A0A5B9MN57_9BACT|nr:sulfatase [Stieleria maiorica]QEG01095.1 Arylsulfatase [Stieleria maiorica]